MSGLIFIDETITGKELRIYDPDIIAVLEAMKRDAERYRWMRMCSGIEQIKQLAYMTPEERDAAIDAARKE